MEFSINDCLDNIVEAIMEEKPQVVAFSTYIWNSEYVRKVAKTIKLIDNSVEILYGGPEVTYDGENFLKNNVGEYIIEGEGEETFREFVEYKLGKVKVSDIKGIYYKLIDKNKETDIVYNGKRPIMDMNRIVFPYNEDDDLQNKIVYYEASRGCPFRCKYCLSSVLTNVRFLNVERVKKDLIYLIEKDVKLIKFVDRTFNCNGKFAMEIWGFLMNYPCDTTFHFEISSDILKKEELELLSKAPKGKFQFEVGVQTTNDEVLKNINRYVRFDHIKENIQYVQKNKNIKQHLDLIAGLPGEDLESFKKSFNDVYSIEPEEIQLGFLKLIKGTSMREEAKEWGMVASPYAPYEILKTKDISYDELLSLKKVENMVDTYYNSGKFNLTIKYLRKCFDNPFEFYESLANYFENHGYFKRSISNNDYYKFFLDFNKDILKIDTDIIREILRYEYLCVNKKRGIPEFLRGDMSKEQERNIKDILRERGQKLENSSHIEKFNIDIAELKNKNSMYKKNIYIIFNEKKEPTYFNLKE